MVLSMKYNILLKKNGDEHLYNMFKHKCKKK